MKFRELARRYLGDLQLEMRSSKRTQQYTPELSYRPVLDRFFRDIVAEIDSKIRVIYEPKRQASSGHPDWRFYHSSTLGVYGYVESKEIDSSRSLSVEEHKEQLQKYLVLNNVILTDGIEFVFCDQKGQRKTLSILPKPLDQSIDWKTLEPDARLETEFRTFFAHSGFRECSEEQLIAEAAKWARQLARNIETLADLPIDSALDEDEKRTIGSLNELKILLQNHHDPALRAPKAFADFVAQVLVFGLLYSHAALAGKHNKPTELYESMRRFWSKTAFKRTVEQVRPLRSLVGLLQVELRPPGPIGTWYDDCMMMLAHVRLRKGRREAPNYHVLYERFLEVFDPKTRFDYGAFYTPPELAKFTVELTQAIAHLELNGKSLYEKENKLIDPCCGTGNFLEQLIVHGGRKASLPQVIGFEILPAPYTLAHHRLSMLAGRRSYPNLSILLTDTLSDELEQTLASKPPTNLIEAEQQLARKLARPPLTLIIGNPPSSDSYRQSQGRNRQRILRLLEDFRPPRLERHQRQNIQKQIQNEFVKFLRWSCDKLLQSQVGILALILPASFADDVSYKHARKWLIEHFQKLWLLEIDKDGRTSVSASSIFNTLQGRILVVGLRIEKPKRLPRGCMIFHHSISNLDKTGKLRLLKHTRSQTDYIRMFKPVNIDSISSCFTVPKSFDRKLYSGFWQLCPAKPKPEANERFIFLGHVSGVKLAPSSLFVHADRQILWRRSRDVSELSIGLEELKSRWFEGQDKTPSPRKLSDDVRKAIGAAINLPKPPIRGYSYRPFMNLYALISPGVLQELAKMPNSGTRARSELLSAFESGDTVGIAVAPAPKHLGDRLRRFSSFCWELPDDDLCRRGSARIYCNKFPEYKTKAKKKWKATPIPNINPELLKCLHDILGGDPERILDDIVYYVHAILCSDSFLDTFEGALFVGSDPEQRPRIPIPANAQMFRRIAAFGKRIALLEKGMDQHDLKGRFAALTGLYSHEFKLTDHKAALDAERIDLIENGAVKLSICPIPRDILCFEVSGYSVIQQWLKMYSYPYTRTNFTEEHYSEFLRLLYRIETQLEVLKELDADVWRIVSGREKLL